MKKVTIWGISLRLSRFLPGNIIFSCLVGLILLLDGRPTYGKDISNALENYRTQADSAALDDRCKVLTPDERSVLNVYREGLTAFIQANEAGFASSKASIDSESRAAAQTAHCDKASITVRSVYEETVATKLSLRPALLSMAMNLGERCNVISKEDDNTLMRAWAQMGNDVVKQYNASIRARYVVHEAAAEQQSQKLPCSDARQTIDLALKLASQVLHQ